MPIPVAVGVVCLPPHSDTSGAGQPAEPVLQLIRCLDRHIARQSRVCAVRQQFQPAIVHRLRGADVLHPGAQRSARHRDRVATAPTASPGELLHPAVRPVELRCRAVLRPVIRSGRGWHPAAAVGLRRRRDRSRLQSDPSLRRGQRLPGIAHGHDVRWPDRFDDAPAASADARRGDHQLCHAVVRHDRQDHQDLGGHPQQPLSRNGRCPALQERAGRVSVGGDFTSDVADAKPRDDRSLQLHVHIG